MGKATREEVYKAIDGERLYQGLRWNPNTSSTGGEHVVTEFLVYIQDYVNEALHMLTRAADPIATEFALNSIRKITALGVATMEQHGAPPRILTHEQLAQLHVINGGTLPADALALEALSAPHQP